MASKVKKALAGKMASAFVLLFILFPLMCLMDGVSTLIHQCTNWVKTGVWVPVDFWSGVHRLFLTSRPTFAWVIPNRILNWMLDGPRWVWMIAWSAILMVAELALLLAAVSFGDRLYRRWRAQAQGS